MCADADGILPPHRIAQEYGVDVTTLAKRNGLPLNALLMIGDTLIIPVR